MDPLTNHNQATVPLDDGITRTPLVTDQENPVIKEYVAAVQKGATQDVLDHHKMLATLYFLLDAFERAQVQFFLVRQTAHDAMTLHQLTGDHIHIGVRNNEWLNGNQELLFPYFEQEHIELKSELPNELTYEWQGTPFTIHFYEDNECTTSLIPLSYEHENWNIPNQFERFEKEFDK